jgi:hypothetical protein
VADVTQIGNAVKHTIESIRQEAEAEINAEIAKLAKSKLVTKMRQVADAKKVVANLEAELEVIHADLKAELEGK